MDDTGAAYRQMLVSDTISKSSNRKQSEFFLSDQSLPLDDPSLIQINKAEFDTVWFEINSLQQESWLKLKELLPVGTLVEGYIEALYPQGVIATIPDYEALAIAEYEDCAANSASANLHVGLFLTAIVVWYDDVNDWICLGAPSILGHEHPDFLKQQTEALHALMNRPTQKRHRAKQ